jgi:preprotein translocase subunit YajC
MYSSQPTAPGSQGSAPPTSAGTAPADAGPPGAGAASPFGGGITPILIMVLPILLIFFTMRGQTKKQKQIESNLKTGDTVVTQSGLIGKVVEFVGETRVRVEIAPGVTVRMLKSAISGVDGGDVKPDAKDAKDAKDATKDKPQEKKA